MGEQETDSSGRFALVLEAGDPKPLSDACQAGWPAIVRDVRDEEVRTGLVFVAELLELLDGGAACRFAGGLRSGGFGEVSEG